MASYYQPGAELSVKLLFSVIYLAKLLEIFSNITTPTQVLKTLVSQARLPHKFQLASPRKIPHAMRKQRAFSGNQNGFFPFKNKKRKRRYLNFCASIKSNTLTRVKIITKTSFRPEEFR